MSAAVIQKGLHLRSPFLINSQFLSQRIYFALSKANITVKKLLYKHSRNAWADWNDTSTTRKQNSMQRRVHFMTFHGVSSWRSPERMWTCLLLYLSLCILCLSLSHTHTQYIQCMETVVKSKVLFMHNWKFIQASAIRLSDLCYEPCGISSECERLQRTPPRKRFHLECSRCHSCK